MSAPLRRLALTAALLAAPPLALAQTAAPAVTVEGARSYTPSDFARYSPRSALEMLQQVPGFVIRDAVQERGLGQATGNVLLNGQRMSGKSNDVLAQLGKIPANTVVRIEIRDGATLGIPGLSGPVANVVAKAGGVSGSWAWRPDVRRHFTDPQLTRGEVSISGARENLEYTLGFDNSANHSGAGGGTTIFEPDGRVREWRDEIWTGESERPRLTGTLGWTGAGGDEVNLNASYQRVYFDYEEDGVRTGPALVERLRTVRQTQRGYNREIGGDWETALAGGRLKLIGLDRYVHNPVVTAVEVTPTDASARTGSRFSRDAEETERIARAEYSWQAGGDWQVSGEYAFNRLDSASALVVLDPNGTYVPVPLPGGTAVVEEDRYEAMGTYGRTLSPTLSMQLSLGGEYSRLEQVGAGGLTRAFRRPKGLLSFAWQPAPGFDVNAKLQRRVGQLNFYDFLASVDLNDDQSFAGNPDLVPPQTWELELEASRTLGDWGNTALRLYTQRIDDIVDVVPIGVDGESTGNIDRATRHGVEWKHTLLFDPIGWRGAKLDARVQVERSRVRDPLTGEQRPISNNLQELVELGLRHDVPDTDWAWGANASYGYYARDYRLTEVGRVWEGPIWGSLFLERKNLKGLTVRVTASNITDAMSMWDRTVYLDRRTGPIDYIEVRDRRIGPILSFAISGTF
ncbi:TonB-dependent receptor plug domain-containing protein [Cognatilysobacter bugurensis]|uniref:TonB-dependent receptor n=1 Tax=Cognatilysobacter bugurensis TaxID=543356 RepID=A0A918W650_9GAMM|nr:TonB-dependent receptor [Lysobacter bugurensis]GHA72694.1 TonB-dependent receptor [Lysobacter bugurensis]